MRRPGRFIAGLFGQPSAPSDRRTARFLPEEFLRFHPGRGVSSRTYHADPKAYGHFPRIRNTILRQFGLPILPENLRGSFPLRNDSGPSDTLQCRRRLCPRSEDHEKKAAEPQKPFHCRSFHEEPGSGGEVRDPDAGTAWVLDSSRDAPSTHRFTLGRLAPTETKKLMIACPGTGESPIKRSPPP